MKSSIKLICAVTASAALLAACSKPESEATVGDVKKAVDKTATGMSEAAKPAAQGATAEMQAMAEAAKTQPLIDKAKSLITDKKYPEALAALQELGKLKLTPEQEKLVASLKEQLAKATTVAPTAVPTNAIPRM